MSGMAFGLVLGVSGYHFYSHMSCGHATPPQVVRVVQAPAQPCPAVAPAAPAAPQLVNVPETPPPAQPASAAEVDAQADQNLALAKSLATTDPRKARDLCRKTMQLYNNNPRNERVRTAFKLLNTIRGADE